MAASRLITWGDAIDAVASPTMSIRRAVPVALLSVLMAGCFTGQRPSFSEEVTTGSTGDPTVDELIAMINDPADPAPVTADYTVLTKYGNTTTEASVARGRKRTSVTIGDIRFLDDGMSTSTCRLDTGSCTSGFDESTVSDTLVTSAFATESPIARMRQDVRNASGPATRSEREVGDVPSTCAQIELTDGTTLYCVADTGLITLQDTADVRVEVTSMVDGVDAAAFATSR